MSTSGVEGTTAGTYQVTAYREGTLHEQWTFADLRAAEAFMEEWGEQHPGDLLAIDDHSVDHSGFELVDSGFGAIGVVVSFFRAIADGEGPAS